MANEDEDSSLEEARIDAKSAVATAMLSASSHNEVLKALKDAREYLQDGEPSQALISVLQAQARAQRDADEGAVGMIEDAKSAIDIYRDRALNQSDEND